MARLRFWLRSALTRARERFWIWLAWLLPRELVMWCAVRVGAHATTGDWGHVTVPDLTFMDALKRWDGAKPDDPLGLVR